jgi:hypothetical protein
MGTSTPYPNGQVLISDALTVSQINDIIQTLTCGMIGINPPDPSQVRVDWQTQGQPYKNVGTDVCFIACTLKPNPYTQVRDVQLTQTGSGDDVVLSENWGYTRVWRIAWVFNGPNATDRARQVWSAMFMEYFTDQLSQYSLFPVPDMQEPLRVPFESNAQWWEEAHFEVEMYEAVTETINDGIATSVEISVEGNSGLLAEVTATSQE